MAGERGGGGRGGGGGSICLSSFLSDMYIYICSSMKNNPHQNYFVMFNVFKMEDSNSDQLFVHSEQQRKTSRTRGNDCCP